jgi:hypothetical protein
MVVFAQTQYRYYCDFPTILVEENLNCPYRHNFRHENAPGVQPANRIASSYSRIQSLGRIRPTAGTGKWFEVNDLTSKPRTTCLNCQIKFDSTTMQHIITILITYIIYL